MKMQMAFTAEYDDQGSVTRISGFPYQRSAMVPWGTNYMVTDPTTGQQMLIVGTYCEPSIVRGIIAFQRRRRHR